MGVVSRSTCKNTRKGEEEEAARTEWWRWLTFKGRGRKMSLKGEGRVARARERT